MFCWFVRRVALLLLALFMRCTTCIGPTTLMERLDQVQTQTPQSHQCDLSGPADSAHEGNASSLSNPSWSPLPIRKRLFFQNGSSILMYPSLVTPRPANDDYWSSVCLSRSPMPPPSRGTRKSVSFSQSGDDVAYTVPTSGTYADSEPTYYSACTCAVCIFHELARVSVLEGFAKLMVVVAQILRILVKGIDPDKAHQE